MGSSAAGVGRREARPGGDTCPVSTEEEEEGGGEGQAVVASSDVVALVCDNGRPARQCKTNTNTLVALSLEDESRDIKFEDSEEEEEEEEDEKPLRPPRRKRKRSGGVNAAAAASRTPVAAVSVPAAVEEVADGNLKDSDASLSAEGDSTKEQPKCNSNNASGDGNDVDRGSSPKAGQEQQQEEEESGHSVQERLLSSPHTPLADADQSSQDAAAATSDETPLVTDTPAKRGRGRPKLSPEERAEERKTRKKRKKKRRFQLSTKKKSRTESATPPQTPSKKSTVESASERSNSKSNSKRVSVLSAPLQELLPDLSPTGPASLVRSTKRAVSEKERAAKIVEEVCTPERPFRCPRCQCGFSHYALARRHSCQGEGNNVFKSCRGLVPPSRKSSQGDEEEEAARFAGSSSDYSSLISSALRRVPETTFNSMHGTLAHVGSVDADSFKAAGGAEAISTVDKVCIDYYCTRVYGHLMDNIIMSCFFLIR